MLRSSSIVTLSCTALYGAFVSCSSQRHYTLMPTPVIYTESRLDPFAHLQRNQKTPDAQVFYATTRLPQETAGQLNFGNRYGSLLNLGTAEVFLSDPSAPWETVKALTLSNTEDNKIPLTLGKVSQMASFSSQSQAQTPPVKAFTDEINKELASSLDKEIMIYVHGTKVDFANSALLTAEIDHFSGRDFVGVAFSWPSHQNIFSYLTRIDVHRAQHSSDALERLILLLAENTAAKKINILSYSAGGRVTSKALHALGTKSPATASDTLKKRYRLGSVVFAAADVELDTFLERLEPISRISDQVAITMSDADNALIAGKRFMGGGSRAGMEESLAAEKAFATRKKLKNIEFIDVSAGKATRGFDITGHHYWYRHPWMSSDIILSMRTELNAGQRGLSPTEAAGVWSFSSTYPQKVAEVAEKHFQGQW